ncbi:hypothetical protein HDU80_007337 [Chytriomyces hyalinus]|nr:hypothetical protein HDU80_007336 [Chytriomyces hyalinus]KAJ3400038.1 hypothetical protein HDU80_007337 [Chytriomyces hyalinus]
MLCKIVIQANEVPAWGSEVESLSINAMNAFVLVSESSSKQKPIPLSDLIPDLLVASKPPKSVIIYVQKYSNAVINSTTFKKAQKVLLRPLAADCANAATESAQNDVVARLKVTHGTRFIASEVNWVMWANSILSGDAHLIDHAISTAPPQELIQFFKSPLTEAAVHNRMSRQANLVAINKNTRVLAELEDMRESQLAAK